jgi:PAS domain S-box-containing protein
MLSESQMKPMNEELPAFGERSAPLSASPQFPTMPPWLLDQLPIGLAYRDKEGRYVFVNSSFSRLLRSSPAEFIGKTAEEVVAARVPQASGKLKQVEATRRNATQHALIMENGQSLDREEAYIDADGKEGWLHITEGPLLGPDATIIGSQAVLIDVSERKRKEAELSSEREMMRALMDSTNKVNYVIYFKDLQSRFRRCSANMAPFFKLASVDEAIGKSDFDFQGQKHAREAYADEQEIIRTGQPMIGKSEKEDWPDGRTTWSLSSKMPLYSEQGAIIGTFGISQDITAMKEAEAKVEKLHTQLLQTSREAGMAEVATNILHNVGNVLNSVNVSASMLLDRTANSKLAYLSKAVALFHEHSTDLGQYLSNDPKGKLLPDYLAQLAKQLTTEQQDSLSELHSLGQHIEHIRAIVALQQNYAKVSGVAEAVDVIALVEDSLEMNAGALVRHEVGVVRDYSEVPQITTDKHKILQILVNLIRNAKYACDESERKDRQIALKVCQSDQWVSISVIDNGVGIPAENRTRIFNHGFTTRKSGHGFGLHSSALAAAELGGTLTAHSDGAGQGATFTLALPVEPPNCVS